MRINQKTIIILLLLAICLVIVIRYGDVIEEIALNIGGAGQNLVFGDKEIEFTEESGAKLDKEKQEYHFTAKIKNTSDYDVYNVSFEIHFYIENKIVHTEEYFLTLRLKPNEEFVIDKTVPINNRIINVDPYTPGNITFFAKWQKNSIL